MAALWAAQATTSAEVDRQRLAGRRAYAAILEARVHETTRLRAELDAALSRVEASAEFPRADECLAAATAPANAPATGLSASAEVERLSVEVQRLSEVAAAREVEVAALQLAHAQELEKERARRSARESGVAHMAEAAARQARAEVVAAHQMAVEGQVTK
jgi:hypothetical protein